MVTPHDDDVMPAIKAFITRHPVPTYYVLTFAISDNRSRGKMPCEKLTMSVTRQSRRLS